MDNVIIAVRWISTFCCLLLSLFVLVTFFKPLKSWFSKAITIIPAKNKGTRFYFLVCALLFIAVAVFNFILKGLYIIIGVAFILCAIILILRAILPNGIYDDGIISDFKLYKWSDVTDFSWDEEKLTFKDKKGSPEVLVFDVFKKDEALEIMEKHGINTEQADNTNAVDNVTTVDNADNPSDSDITTGVDENENKE